MASIDTVFLPPDWKPGDPIPTTGATESPTVTISQSQATPSASDDQFNNVAYVAPPPSSSGVGAGTSPNAYDSRGNDNTPPASSNTSQQVLNQAFANQGIVPQPNVLDQYASYTYAISWWLLTPDQYNKLSSGLAPAPGTGNWSLLMQSGGAPTAGRNPYFPDDYYLDDLEIETVLMGKGTNMSTNGIEIKFKVVEPNGITLIQNLYKAVVSAYKNATPAQPATGQPTTTANQTRQVPNYAAAQYCLTIEFYGYDSQGNLVAPATGQYSSTGQLSNTNPQAVIKKYYPFLIENITFRTASNQVEYNIVGKSVAYNTATSQARGTIPFAFALTGQTVSQILQGTPASSTVAAGDPGTRTSAPSPQTSAFVPQVDSPETAALFNDGTGYNPGYDPAAGWSG